MKKLLLLLAAFFVALSAPLPAAVVKLPLSSTITVDNTYTADTQRGGSYCVNVKGTFGGATVSLQYYNATTDTWDEAKSFTAATLAYVHIANGNTARFVVTGSTGTTVLSVEIFGCAPLSAKGGGGGGPYSTDITDFLTAADYPGARGKMGLGTMATQSASSVAITGGSITGITDIAVADGGTGSSTAAGARTNLGVERPLARLIANRRKVLANDLPQFKAVMSSPPTVTTVGATAPAGLTKVYTVGTTAAGDTNFLIQGELGRVSASGYVIIYGANVPSGGNVSSTQYSEGVVWDTIADCDEIAFRIIQTTVVSIEVDGQFTSLTPTTLATNGTGPFDSYLDLAFSTKGIHRIKIHIPQGTARLWDVRVKPTASIWRPKVETSAKLQIFADSHSAGVGSTVPGFSWPRVFAQASGFDGNWDCAGISSTGFTVASTTAAYDGHLSDITTYGPDVLMFCGSVNDDVTAPATITSRVVSTLTAARALAPNAVIAVTGVIAGHTANANDLITENAVLAGYTAWSDGNKIWLPVMTATGGSHIFGTGVSGTPTGNGNADFYIGGSSGSDVIHMTYQGHAYQGLRLAYELQAALQSF